MKKLLLVSLVLVGCTKNVEINKPAPVPPAPFVQTIPFNIKLNGPLVSGGSVSDKFQASKDKLKIAYVADESIDTVDDLYSVNIDGTSKLNLTNLSLGKKVTLFVMSPVAQKVAFLADINTTGRFDLYTINLDGTNLHRVNLGLSDNAQVVENNFRFNNAGNKVIFVTDEEATGSKNIYAANTDGSSRLRLNQVLGTQITYALAADDSRVVYRPFSFNPVLRSVTLSGTGDVVLNSAFNLGLNPASGVLDFKISPDSSKVAFRSNQDDGAIYDLIVVNLDGTGPRTKVNGPIVAQGLVSPSYDFATTTSKIVYIADQTTDEVQELYSSNLDGTGNVKLSGSLVSGGNVTSFKLSTTNSKVVYLADQTIDGVNELYSSGLDGAAANTKINSSLVVGERVVNQYDVIGSKVVYATDKSQSGFYSVWSNSLLVSNEVKISDAISTGIGFFDNSNLTANQFDPLMNGLDIARIILVGSNTSNNKDIRSVNLDGTTNKKLNDQTGGNGVSLSVNQLGSTFIVVGDYVVYRYNNGVSTELYVALARD